MKSFLYATFDTCAGVYSKPFTANSDNEIMRSFGDIVMDSKHPIGQHPEHYSLWRIGTFNDQDAKVTSDEKECLITALECVALNSKGREDQSVLKANGDIKTHPDTVNLNYDPCN